MPQQPRNKAEKPTGARRLSFDVVIATRNRAEALALSVPLILAQSRQPAALIVIDSSQDHGPVADAIATACAGWNGRLVVEHSAPGLPYQRNLGLAHVRADVVIFPDDDSLFHPGTSEAIMAAYERDRDGAIAAVCAAEAATPPAGVDLGGDYSMSAAHRREAGTRRLRNRIERRFSQLKPALYLGAIFRARRAVPQWLAGANCVPVEYMTGFRMSFRTAAIRVAGFDDNLQTYALDEDIDASFSAARSGLVIGARDAQIYHHRFPGGRGNGYTLGVIAVLNRVYVVMKHAADGNLSDVQRRAARRRLRVFIWLKLLVSLAGIRSGFGRARLRGAVAAARHARALMKAPRAGLGNAYRVALKEIGV